jgi:hypothetical protein
VTNKLIHFISGHLDLTQQEFDAHYRPAIDQALKQNEHFIVGDARGADALAQQYLYGKTTNVVVYHMMTAPRVNAGFQTIGGFQSDSERDRQMTQASLQDIAWVRPGRERSGTQANLNRRKKHV